MAKCNDRIRASIRASIRVGKKSHCILNILIKGEYTFSYITSVKKNEI